MKTSLTIIAIIISVGAAYFAWQSKEVARQSMEAGLRAYVFAMPGNVFNVSGNQKWEPRIIIRNSGQTFATGTKRHIGIKVSAPLSPVEESRLGIGTLEEGAPVISPKGGADNVVFRRGEKISDDIQEQIKSEKLRLYVFGRIEYEDVFGSPHWTEFCHFYTGEQQPWPEELGGPGFEDTQAKYCTKHNDVDKDDRN